MPTTTSTTTELLVVDPRPNDYLPLAADVEAADIRFLFASSGDEALRLPSHSLARLWLINFRLPDMTGVELLALVRSRDPDAACLLIGDTYTKADELSARQFGATLYACKPPLAAWLQALPAFRMPRDRDHLAHGPPEARISAAPTVPAATTRDRFLNLDHKTIPTQE